MTEVHKGLKTFSSRTGNNGYSWNSLHDRKRTLIMLKSDVQLRNAL